MIIVNDYRPYARLGTSVSFEKSVYGEVESVYLDFELSQSENCLIPPEPNPDPSSNPESDPDPDADPDPEHNVRIPRLRDVCFNSSEGVLFKRQG